LINIKTINKNNFLDWRKAVRKGFGDIRDFKDMEILRLERVEINRLIAAIDDETNGIVGTGGTDSFNLTIPGFRSIKMGGIAYMTTSITHRRRGIWTELMNYLHDDAVNRGEIMTGLWASQSNLYRRFGYGIGTLSERWNIKSRFTSIKFHSDPDFFVELVEQADALEVFPSIYESFRKKNVGMINRSGGRWRYEIHQVKKGQNPVFYLMCSRNGKPDGYMIYKTVRSGDMEMGSIEVIEELSLSVESSLHLWSLIVDSDLTNNIVADNRPHQDPLLWYFTNPRSVTREIKDGVWYKLINVKKCLEMRAYSIEDSKTIKVLDPTNLEDFKNFRVESTHSGANVYHSNSEPDIEIYYSDLASAFMGVTTFSLLHQTGRLRAKSGSIIDQLDMMFGTNNAWCPHYF